jgi:hypothetical protein
MRSFFIPCLILIGLAVFGLFIALSSFQNVARLQRDVVSIRQDVDDSKTMNAITEGKINVLRTESRPAEGFLKQWQRTFLNGDDASRTILPDMDSLAVANLVSSSQKQTHSEPGYTFRNKTIPIERVEITVGGEYYRLINWLGAVEQEFPLARVETVSFTNEDGLKLSASFSFPIYFKIPSAAPITTAATP